MEDTGTSLKIVPVGKTVTLTCVVSGNPGPLVRWTKTNGRLPAGVMVQGGVLKIASANVEDSGTYRCSAHNSLGFVHADIQVFVQGKQYRLSYVGFKLWKNLPNILIILNALNFFKKGIEKWHDPSHEVLIMMLIIKIILIKLNFWIG